MSSTFLSIFFFSLSLGIYTCTRSHVTGSILFALRCVGRQSTCGFLFVCVCVCFVSRGGAGKLASANKRELQVPKETDLIVLYLSLSHILSNSDNVGSICSVFRPVDIEEKKIIIHFLKFFWNFFFQTTLVLCFCSPIFNSI